MKVALKFCGSCNPQVELGPLAARLRDLLGAQGAFLPLAEGDLDLVVILNGCPKACADRPEVRARARAWLVVAGESVDLEPVPEAELAARLAALINKKSA